MTVQGKALYYTSEAIRQALNYLGVNPKARSRKILIASWDGNDYLVTIKPMKRRITFIHPEIDQGEN